MTIRYILIFALAASASLFVGCRHPASAHSRKLNKDQLELIHLAKKQLDKGELDVAELNVRTVLASSPDDPAARYYLSLVEEAQQRTSLTRHRGWRLTP